VRAIAAQFGIDQARIYAILGTTLTNQATNQGLELPFVLFSSAIRASAYLTASSAAALVDRHTRVDRS
jgi:hypothetical protein